MTYSISAIRSNISVSADSAGLAATSLEWRRRALQNLFLSILYHGEVRPCQEVARANAKKLEQASKVQARATRPRHRSSSLNRVVQRKKVDAKERRASKVGPAQYTSFVISCSIEYRRWLMPDSIPERQLQKMAKGVYGSILLSLLNARPLAQSSGKPGEEGGVARDVYRNKLEGVVSCRTFPETLSMLVCALEQALRSATAARQSPSKADLLTTLSFWHEINDVLVIPAHQYEHLNMDDIPQATSTNCCLILVDYLLTQTIVPPAVWQASLTNLLMGLLNRKDLFVDYDKLLSMLVQFFTSASVVVSDLVPRIVNTLLDGERELVSEAKGLVLSGDCLLLEVIIIALQGRYENRLKCKIFHFKRRHFGQHAQGKMMTLSCS